MTRASVTGPKVRSGLPCRSLQIVPTSPFRLSPASSADSFGAGVLP